MSTIFLWLDNQAPAVLKNGPPQLLKLWEKTYPNYKRAVIGHAAMHITDEPKPMLKKRTDGGASWNNDSEAYVSWFPAGGQSHTARKKAEAGNTHYKRGVATHSLFRDLAYEKYAPDTIIRIKTGPNQQARMLKAWEKFKNKKPKRSRSKGNNPVDNKQAFGPSYRFYRKNCSDAVAQVLNAMHPFFGSVIANFFDKRIIIHRPRSIGFKIKMGYLWNNKQMKWDDYLLETFYPDDHMQRYVMCGEAYESLKKFRRRQNNDGTSWARSRFVYEEGYLTQDTGNNTYQYIIDECDNIGLEFPRLKARDLKIGLKSPADEMKDLIPPDVKPGDEIEDEQATDDDDLMVPPDDDEPPPPPLE